MLYPTATNTKKELFKPKYPEKFQGLQRFHKAGKDATSINASDPCLRETIFMECEKVRIPKTFVHRRN